VSDRIRRPDVQGLRAVAVVLVIAFHTGLPALGGYVGVDVFFVISGFVISGLLLRESERSGTINLRGFYMRRLRRLTPALGLMVATVVLASAILQSAVSETSGQELTAKTAVGALLFAGNVVLYRVPVDGYFAARAGDNPLLHTWSLGVEEQFYLVFPLLLMATMAIAGARRSRRALIVVVAAVGAVSLAASIVFSYALVAVPGMGAPESFAFYLPLTRAWEFAVGALIALSAASTARIRPGAARLAAGVGSVGLVTSGVLLVEGMAPFPGVVAMIPVVSTALLIIGGSGPSRPLVTRLLSTRWMTAVGDRSYSLYLWHWPFIVLVPIVLPTVDHAPLVGALLSLIPAMLAYRFVENPLRQASGIKVRWIAVSALGAPVALSLVLFAGSVTGWGDENTKNLQTSLQSPTLGVRAGCFTGGTIDHDVFARCRIPVEGESAGTILLVGDSHADSLSDGIVAAAHQLSYDVVTVTGGSCPYVGPAVALPDTVSNCEQLNRWRTEFALSGEAALVVTAQASAGREGRADEWVEGNVDVLEELETAAVPVLWVGDVPYLGVNGSPCWYGVLLSRCEADKDVVLNRQREGLEVDAAVVEQLDNVTFWSPFDEFCDDETCVAHDGDMLLYRDPEHLNAHGGMHLVDGLQAAMGQALESSDADRD
jgi:peptidoglycan/LPS O-acetylase OafA/YrhL